MNDDHTEIPLQLDPTHQRMSGFTNHGGHNFNVPYITQVHDRLWVGGCETGLLLPLNIVHVVSLYPWKRYGLHPGVRSELYVRAYDEKLGPALEARLEKIADWVIGCLEDGETLLHCQAGLNRSNLVAALVLKRLQPISTFRTIIEHLRARRSPAVLCNESFESYLLSKDKKE
jgi:hypothetical protein